MTTRAEIGVITKPRDVSSQEKLEEERIAFSPSASEEGTALLIP